MDSPWALFFRRCLPSLLLFLLTVAVFLPSCRNGFIAGYDDELYLTLNSAVREGLTSASIRWAFTTFQGGNWHPITWLSHLADVSLFGFIPAGHHLISVLVHAATTLLLFRMVERLGFDRGPAWCLAAFFAVHPQRVESVAWAAERKDVLSVFFGVAALLSYIGYCQRPALKRYLPVVILFSLSLLSKPMLVTMPLLLLLVDHFCFERLQWTDRSTALAEKAPLFLLAGGITLVTFYAQAGSNAIVAAPPWSRIMVALSAYGEYLRLFFLPIGLSFHYPLEPGDPGIFQVVAGGGIVAGGILAALRRGDPLLRLGCAWFLLTLLPVSGIIRFGGQFVADRYTYFPHIGLLLILARIVPRLWSQKLAQRRILAALIAGLLLTSSLLTGRQIGYWHDGERLFRRAIELNPRNWLAHNNLAAALIQQDRYGEGFLHLARSQMLRGRPVEALETLAYVYRHGGVAPVKLDELKEEILRRMR